MTELLRRLTGVALATCALMTLTACPALFVSRGELVRPTRSNARPTVAQLPAADRYVDLETAWRREARVGVGGAVVGTLRDPGLEAAAVAHEAALQRLDAAATQTLLENRWATAYGPDGDRFPIDLHWRFDEQFIAHKTVLDPTEWQFTLHADGLGDFAPLAIVVLTRSAVATGGFWEGKVRLWFPWRDIKQDQLLLGGGVSAIDLRMQHRSGVGTLTWRFSNLF